MALGGMILPGGESPESLKAYQEAAEAFFGGSSKAFAFWKGRIALYSILNAMNVRGGEVIVPGYTCVMVPGPVIYSGATPVYVDIDPQTYALDPREVEKKITPRTKAILVQHTYGLPAAVAEIKQIADRHGIAIIEDCCHTFGGRVDGKLLGTFGKAAFFSGQWNKPFSTGLGGLALIHDAGLADKVRDMKSQMPLPSFKAKFMLASQLLVYEAIVRPSTTALIARMFRWMTKKGLVVGSSSKAEFEPVMPQGYALRATRLQCRLGRAEVGRAGANRLHRQQVTRQYLDALPALGFNMPEWPGLNDLMILRLPLRVANKQEALERAASYGVEIGSWFECPLHPIETDQKAFGYNDGDCPQAEKAAREVINLPTHRRVSEKDVKKTLAFVREVCRPVRG